MSKRAFVREAGVLIDSYEDPPGNKCCHRILAYMLGESMSAEERVAVLSRARSASGDAHAVQDDQSPELLDALLSGLAALNISVPMDLTRFLDDTRVQPALVDATRRVPAESLANFAQVLGMVGGPGSREVLRDRLAELAQDPETFADDPFFNHKAGALATTACSLLALEPDADTPADALLRLFTHPCGFNRRSVHREVTTLVLTGRAKRTQPMRRLAAAIESATTTADDELFLHVCETMPRPAARERIERLLGHESFDIRQHAINALTRRAFMSARTLACLRDRLADEKAIRLRIYIAAQLASLVAPTDLAPLLEEALADESPSLRHEAIALLRSLPKSTARDVARRARADEPDPALARSLEAWGGLPD